MDGTQSFPEIVKLLIENGLQSTLILFFLTLIFGLILGMIIAKGRMSKLLIIQMPIRFFLLIMRGTPPVSYTHLDVYKRQESYRSQRSI